MPNRNLNTAARAKDDEFYTRYEDIDAELKHYKAHFKGKRVYLPCDNPQHSQFCRYFADKKDEWGISSVEYSYLDGRQGDFRSMEVRARMKDADIVVTNPPFSLFRHFFAVMQDLQKKFIAIAPLTAVHYKSIFPYIRDNEVWLSSSNYLHWFDTPSGEVRKALGVWMTNLDLERRHTTFLPLTKSYNTDDYEGYDNYPAINVARTLDIPKDYKKRMGVPESFLLFHNPNQFRIVEYLHSPKIRMRAKYGRVIIEAV